MFALGQYFFSIRAEHSPRQKQRGTAFYVPSKPVSMLSAGVLWEPWGVRTNIQKRETEVGYKTFDPWRRQKSTTPPALGSSVITVSFAISLAWLVARSSEVTLLSHEKLEGRVRDKHITEGKTGGETVKKIKEEKNRRNSGKWWKSLILIAERNRTGTEFGSDQIILAI